MKSFAPRLLIACALVAGGLLLSNHALPAAGPFNASGLGLDSGKPIAVNADSFLADLKGETGTYTGNVIVTQGEVKLHADEVTVLAPGGRAQRMEAKGHVIVDSPSGQAVGDNGVYDVAAQNLRLTGHVVLTQDANVMRGSELQVSMATGIATLSAAPQTPGEAPGRVQGLFAPAQKQDTAAPPAATSAAPAAPAAQPPANP
ncbi:MAG TPA: LptA/OstA family protein [Micropepsaceae bacterium]|nr:LptA/OstA family protein [Micropepsaceae bacterium]